ncbi:MAG: hypothetical protein QHH13_08210 [Melioribacter sp.]|uniref:hypothetical protein n=1 Tax=Rosettibacter primus TaxID=3111523 RepID=UPI00247BD3AD|nr:hypothetical protein [Melioribacter sp.]
METFKYSFFAKIIYRYGNIIATLMLSVHLISSIYYISEKIFFIIPAIINSAIIFYLNKYFFKTYKLFPFEITISNNKLICKDFFLSKKKIEIDFRNIDKLSGGIFSGYPTRPIYIHDKSNGTVIGFYSHVGNFQKLLTRILQNIPEKLYNELMKNVQRKKPTR